MKKRQRTLQRKSTHSISEVYEAVKDFMDEPHRKVKIIFDGDSIKANSQRYQTFFHKGITCVNCGIKGQFFAKEKAENDGSYHLNLYAVNSEGEEVLMTKDHILPKSKGGKNTLENYQCMCTICNEQKGNQLENKEEK